MRHWISSVAVVSVASTGLLLGMSGAPANAATAAVHLAAANGTSTGQAGYFLAKAPASASAVSTFVVPKITCNKTASGMAPAAIVFTASGLAAAAGVVAQCSGGTASYLGVLLAGSASTATTFTPAAGDKVTATVTSSASATKATLKDVTQTKTQSLKGSGATNASIFLGIDTLANSSTGATLPIPKFAKVPFSAAKIDAKTVKAAGGKPFNLVTSATPPVVEIATSALKSTGNAWTETFKHT
jgi:hypothetical protein